MEWLRVEGLKDKGKTKQDLVSIMKNDLVNLNISNDVVLHIVDEDDSICKQQTVCSIEI